MNYKLIAGIMLVGFSTLSFGAKNFLVKQVLGTDVDHNGVVTQKSLDQGEDYILIKVNPPKLNDNDAVFITSKNAIYSSANATDLLAPNALKNLSIAKMLPTGEVKAYTLANLGYNSIQVITNNKGQQEIVLSKANGQMDKIFVMNYKTKLLPLKSREEVENKKHMATENPNTKVPS